MARRQADTTLDGTRPILVDSDGKPARWVVFVELPPTADGRRRRKKVSGPDPASVITKANEVLNDRAKGVISMERLTVADVVREWLRTKQAVSPATLSNYSTVAARHIYDTRVGRRTLRDLKPDDVRELLRAKQDDEGLSPRTAKLIRTILVAAIGQAEQDGLVYHNVARWAKGPKIGQTRHRAMTEKQAKAFLKAAQGHRYEAAFALMISLGLRPGECLGLQWEDVDLDSRTLTVRHGLKRTGELGSVKNDGSRRQLPIPSKVVPLLRTRMKVQEKEREAAAEYWQGDAFDLIFTSLVGSPPGDRNFARAMRLVCEKAKIPTFLPYELRHTAATLALLAGEPIEKVSRMLGHNDIRITANVYAHIRPRDLESVASTMNSALWGKPRARAN